MARARSQPDLFPPPAEGPEGLVYRPDFLTPDEEADLAARLARLPFAPFEFRGFLGRRRTVSFGWRYDFSGGTLRPADDMPAWLLPFRDRAADLAGAPASAIQHVLLNEYPPGAPIGWHRDRPVFDKVIGISLLAPATLRFRRRGQRGFARAALTAQPRSAYVLQGPSRDDWEHSIPPAQALRYSITFRTFRPAVD